MQLATPTKHYPDTNTTISVHYTTYQAWSGRSFYGRRSGTKAVSAKVEVKVGRITDKAIEFIKGSSKCWVPKSKLQSNEDGSYTVSKGFCYHAGWPNWKQAPIRGHYIGGRFGIMI